MDQPMSRRTLLTVTASTNGPGSARRRSSSSHWAATMRSSARRSSGTRDVIAKSLALDAMIAFTRTVRSMIRRSRVRIARPARAMTGIHSSSGTRRGVIGLGGWASRASSLRPSSPGQVTGNLARARSAASPSTSSSRYHSARRTLRAVRPRTRTRSRLSRRRRPCRTHVRVPLASARSLQPVRRGERCARRGPMVHPSG